MFCYRQIGRNLIIPGGTRIIDARGMYVLPGKVMFNYSGNGCYRLLSESKKVTNF